MRGGELRGELMGNELVKEKNSGEVDGWLKKKELIVVIDYCVNGNWKGKLMLDYFFC